MKKLISMILVSAIIIMVGCGGLEENSSIMTINDKLKSFSKPVFINKTRIGRLPIVMQSIEISFADREDKLFSEEAKQEFDVNSVMDIIIGVKFINYSGIHNVAISVYLPDGSLFRSNKSEIDFSRDILYGSNGLIIDVSNSVAIVKDIVPVAGTEISIFNLVGQYKVEVSVDGKVVAISSFVLK